jgi:uncharacterized membrane protein YdbT with pleckstrin-like domain
METPIMVLGPSALEFFWAFAIGWVFLFIPPIVALLKMFSYKYTVTPKRVIVKTGIIAKNTAEVEIRDIRSVHVEQSAWRRIFGIGHVMVGSAGHASLEIVFRGVKNPQNVKERIVALRQ